MNNGTRPDPPRAARNRAKDAAGAAEPVIEREEVIALLFNVSDIV